LRLGPLPEVPSIALGSGEVTLASLTAAFGAFPGKGVVRRPILISRVEDSEGQVLWTEAGDPHQAMSEVTAFLVSSMLQDVVNAGTASRARSLGFTLPAGGKTGTTNDYMDSWFVGFTPRVVTGVWVGFDQPQPIMPEGYAADIAVPVWAELMKAATAGHKPEWLTRPEGIVAQTVCRVSGKLAVEGCSAVEVTNDAGEVEVRSMAYTEFFRRGTAPTDYCPLHSAAPDTGAEDPGGERKPGFWSRLLGLGRKDEKPAPSKPPPQ
jgi:penicillin-binding protein 1A